VIRRLQRERGNAYVQRVVAALQGTSARLVGRSQSEAAGVVAFTDGARVGEEDRGTKGIVAAAPGSGLKAVVQRSFFGSLWEGVKSVGKAIGGAVVSGATWVAERARDVGAWALNLIRELPDRLRRLGQTLLDGLAGVVSFIPDAIRALSSGGLGGLADWLWDRALAGGTWVLSLISRVLDVAGGPEAGDFIMHLIAHSRPLTSGQLSAAQGVLGPGAIRWHEVRVDEGGLLSLIFRLNDKRAFTTFHTINMPAGEGLAIAVHELTHVYQYERAGSVYLGQAVHAQATIGYGYGGADGLRRAREAGQHYRDFNREQQAQIAQDYYTLTQSGGSASDLEKYEPFIAELKAGDL
jgi:hypothetical protein